LYGAGTANNYLGGSLGIGITSPTSKLHILGAGTTSATTPLRISDSAGTLLMQLNDIGHLTLASNQQSKQARIYMTGYNTYPALTISSSSTILSSVDNSDLYFYGNTIRFYNGTGGTEWARFFSTGNLVLQNGGTFTDAGFRLDVNGTARVSGTLTLTPGASDNAIVINNGGYIKYGTTVYVRGSATSYSVADSSYVGKFAITWGGASSFFNTGGNYIFNGTTANASAMVQIDSTTQGFLPPRMTTTQKNGINTPTAGLVVYDTTLNKLCVYSGTSWETITSL
jgi:hypothetical protein